MSLSKQIEEQEAVLRKLRKQYDEEEERIRSKIKRRLLDFIKTEYDIDLSKDTDHAGTAVQTLAYYLSYIVVCQEG